jgi:DNA-binding transcriptional regulator YhcF (GntR family)
MNLIQIKKKGHKPKYKQIVESIEAAIREGNLKTGDKLPSLNVIKNKHNISRDTVLSAFNELKNRGIIDSTVGKGYFVSSENIQVKTKVFVLFDELNAFKEDLYNALLKHLGINVQVDVFFHHFNKDFFADIIKQNIDNYSYYVIMPANLDGIEPYVKLLDQEKVFILDQMRQEFSEYSSVYQDFENDVFHGLSQLLTDIKKYENFKLIYSPQKQPLGILKGFKRFCENHELRHQVLPEFNENLISKGDLFFVLEDKHLILVIKRMKEKGLEVSKDCGIISYNESMIKEIIEGGITTISTDFKLMGKQLAQMILQNKKAQIANTNRIKIRNSL